MEEANRTSRGRRTSSSSRIRRSASEPRNSVARNSPVERSSAAKPITSFAPATQAEKVIFLGAKLRVSRSARRHHASDFAFHQLLGNAGIFHLFADGHLESLADELGDVAFGGVVGNSAHRHGNAFFLVARGQRDLQLTRGHLRVLEEQLVEVSEAKEQQRVGVVLLDRGILPHQRSGGLAHRSKSLYQRGVQPQVRGGSWPGATLRGFRSNASMAKILYFECSKCGERLSGRCRP